MKNLFYVLVSLAVATIGVAGTKTKKNRRLYSYNYRMIVTPSTLHDVTNTYNWTFTYGVLPSCVGAYSPCLLQSNTPYTEILYLGSWRKLPTIAFPYKISATMTPPNKFSVHPNALANINAATNEAL